MDAKPTEKKPRRKRQPPDIVTLCSSGQLKTLSGVLHQLRQATGHLTYRQRSALLETLLQAPPEALPKLIQAKEQLESLQLNLIP